MAARRRIRSASVGVVGGDHAALAGGDGLHRMEREGGHGRWRHVADAGRMPRGIVGRPSAWQASSTIGAPAASAMARRPACRPSGRRGAPAAPPRPSARAGPVQRLGQGVRRSSARCPDRRRRTPRPRRRNARAVGGGQEGDRRHDAASRPARPPAPMRRPGAGPRCRWRRPPRARAPTFAAKACSKASTVGPGGQVVGAQRLGDGGDVVVLDGLAAVGQEWRHRRALRPLSIGRSASRFEPVGVVVAGILKSSATGGAPPFEGSREYSTKSGSMA